MAVEGCPAGCGHGSMRPCDHDGAEYRAAVRPARSKPLPGRAVSSALAPFRLAFLELKRFRTPLRVAGLVFLALIPLLYGAIYLWSNWNPYGQLASVPVAVVDEDQPVSVGGQQVAAGAQVVASLKKEQLLGWRFVSAADAASGLREGRYYAVITVPADFSAKLASGAGGAPQRASMSIRLDDANNY